MSLDLDKTIAKFKSLREELSKTVNQADATAPNLTKEEMEKSFDELVGKLKREGHSEESAKRIAGYVNAKYVHHYAHKSEETEKAEGDPKHEAKEKKIAEKEKDLAQEMLDMHKGEKPKEYLELFKNGQWHLKVSENVK